MDGRGKSEELRKSYRTRCELPCRYAGGDEGGYSSSNNPHPAIACDLSERGARLVIHQFLPVGRKIRFQLELPQSEPVEAMLEVRWIKEAGYGDNHFEIGGCFSQLTDQQQKQIRTFVAVLALKKAA